MTNLVKLLTAVLLALSLIGCGDGLSLGGSSAARLDTSSEQAYEASLKEVTAPMTAAEKRQFQADLSNIVVSAQLVKMSSSGNASPDEVQAEVLAELDGKTAKQVSDMAKKYREQLSN